MLRRNEVKKSTLMKMAERLKFRRIANQINKIPRSGRAKYWAVISSPAKYLGIL
jgi:hypothetical protein